MEEAWMGKGRDILPFPQSEAKSAIRQLKQRLDDYLMTVQTEIIPVVRLVDEKIEKRLNVSEIGVRLDGGRRDRGGGNEEKVMNMNGENDASQIFGNAFGTGNLAINLNC
jgi:hypothetical protein